MILKFVCIILLLFTRYINSKDNRRFPEGFQFGVATSAYQIEGAWNKDGKGENIWDNFVHQYPSPILNNDTADIACDSYHKYKEDVALIAGLGFNFYRFSISWTRILSTGYTNKINLKGIQYYKNLVAEILKYNMTPVATLYHWDLPQNLVDIGWENSLLVDIFVDYARIVIKNLPGVGTWITFNEPKQVCHYSYGLGKLPPAITSSGLGEYNCVYVVLKAHAKTYHMYKNEFPHYKAKMTITLDCQWYEPFSDSAKDKAAAIRNINFECGIYAHPVYVGDWSEVVKSRIYERSTKENYTKSRLPQFTQEEINYVKGTSDLFALNYYVTFVIQDTEEADFSTTSYANDVRIIRSNVANASSGSNGYPIVPWGLTNILKFIKNEYKNPDILITEIGVSDDGTNLIDDIRINFYTEHFSALLDAIYDHDVNVLGITVWSLLDNFEWTAGYSSHFGIYSIDFGSENRTRTPKKSANFFKQLLSIRRLPNFNNE